MKRKLSLGILLKLFGETVVTPLIQANLYGEASEQPTLYRSQGHKVTLA